MSESKTDPSWLEQIEKANTEQLDALRQQVPEGIERTYFDLQVGELKGIYHFGKSTVEGVIDLAQAGWKVLTDPAAQQKVVEGAVGLAEDYAKVQYGSLEQKHEVVQRAWDKTQQVTQAVKQQMASQWEEAKRTGKQAELIGDWGTQGVLNVATLFIGTGEIKAAATTTKAAAAVAKVEEVTAEAGKFAKAREVASEVSPKVGEFIERCPLAKAQPELDELAYQGPGAHSPRKDTYILDHEGIPIGARKGIAKPGLPAETLSEQGWPDLPGLEARNFNSVEPVTLEPGRKIYRIVDDSLNPSGGYWTEKLPANRAEWRSDYAVKTDWNTNGQYVEYMVPEGPGLKVWMGETSAQQLRGSNFYLPGGGQQIWMPPNTVTPSGAKPTGW